MPSPARSSATHRAGLPGGAVRRRSGGGGHRDLCADRRDAGGGARPPREGPIGSGPIALLFVVVVIAVMALGALRGSRRRSPAAYGYSRGAWGATGGPSHHLGGRMGPGRRRRAVVTGGFSPGGGSFGGGGASGDW